LKELLEKAPEKAARESGVSLRKQRDKASEERGSRKRRENTPEGE